MITAPRAPSQFHGLFDSFISRAHISSPLLRSQGVTPAPHVPEPDDTPAVALFTPAPNNNDDDVAEFNPCEPKPVSESIDQDLPHTRRGGSRYAAPRSALWAARRIQEDKPESAIAILRNWTHNLRHREATHEMLATLNGMDDDTVVQALCELRSPMHYVRSSGQRQ